MKASFGGLHFYLIFNLQLLHCRKSQVVTNGFIVNAHTDTHTHTLTHRHSPLLLYATIVVLPLNVIK